jgi:hypothetical protein
MPARHHDRVIGRPGGQRGPARNLEIEPAVGVGAGRIDLPGRAFPVGRYRPVDAQIGAHDGEAPVALVDQERGVAGERHEPAGQVEFRRACAGAPDRDRSASGEVQRSHLLLDPIADQHPSVAELAQASQLAEVMWKARRGMIEPVLRHRRLLGGRRARPCGRKHEGGQQRGNDELNGQASHGSSGGRGRAGLLPEGMPDGARATRAPAAG